MAKKTLRILIIDDTEEDRSVYRRYLEEDDENFYEFDEAEEGQEGLSRALIGAYDMILLDYRLPDLDGIEFMQELVKATNGEHAPVVMITGRGSERIAVEALKLGAYDYVCKSDLTQPELYRAAHNAMARHRQEQRIADAKERLRVSQEHLALLVEGARDHAMILLDKYGHVTQWNAGAELLLGYPPEMALGQHIEFLFEEKDRARGVPREELERAKRGGRYDVDRWLLHKDGRRLWATGSVSLLRAANGGVRGFAKIIRDGTQKRYFDEERSNRSRWFESLLNFLPMPFILIEPASGRVQFANKAAHQFYGGTFPLADSYRDYPTYYGMKDAEGRTLTVDEMPAVRAARGERVHGLKLTWTTARGLQTMLVDASLIAPLFGQEAVVAVTFQDVSALARSEDDLRRAKLQAELANQAKGHFLANMSHEIRTPLGAIIGFSDLLVRKAKTDQDRQRFAAVIKRNGHSLMQIIDDILDLSKIEAGKLRFERIDVNLRALIADVMDLFVVRANDRGITLTSNIDEDVPAQVQVDPTRLRQILFNVIGNAIKFTEQGGVSLTVRVLNRGATLEFDVTDSGIGISQEQRACLFQAFSQADTSTTRRFGGTGLGLLLTRRLTEAMDGDFLLTRSEPGQGSTFAVRLPLLISATERAIPTAKSESHPRGLSGRRVLLIEDNEDNRLFLEQVLRGEGADVESACNGAVGVNLAKEREFDFVLTDIQMPEMDGFTAARVLRERGYKGPILGLSAHAFRDEREKSKMNGFDDYLAKPIEAEALLTRVLELLRPVGREGTLTPHSRPLN